MGREPLVVAGRQSFPGELLDTLGAINVAEGDRAWPVYPVEKVVAANPDLVIDAALNEPEEGLKKLATIAAVRDGRYRRLKTDAALRPGPKLVAALEELFGILHPQPAPAQ